MSNLDSIMEGLKIVQLRNELCEELDSIIMNREALESADQLTEQHDYELTGSQDTLVKIIKRIDELIAKPVPKASEIFENGLCCNEMKPVTLDSYIEDDNGHEVLVQIVHCESCNRYWAEA